MKEEQLYYMAIDQNIASPDRIYRNVTRERVRSRGVCRLYRVAAACCLLLIGTVACIPSARAAVLRWLNPPVDPGDYLHTPAAERQSVPALESAVVPAKEQAVTVSVTDAASGEWRVWAERLSVVFDEILYDGETVYVTGALMGNTADFIKPVDAYLKTEDAQGTSYSPPDDTVVCFAAYSVNGGALKNTHTSAFAHPFFGEDIAPQLAAGSLPLGLQLPAERGLTGTQTLTVELCFTDMETARKYEDSSEHPLVRLRIEGLTFDATAGTNANNALPAAASADLAGEVRVFAIEERPAEGRAEVGNDVLSLSGGRLQVLGMQQKPGGTAVTFCLSLPAGWSAAECRSIADRISVEFVIDGENQGGFGQAYKGIAYHSTSEELALHGASGVKDAPALDDPHNIAFTVETGLLAEDWQRIGTLEVLLSVDEITTFNDAPVPDNARMTVPFSGDGWSEDAKDNRLSGCMLKIK